MKLFLLDCLIGFYKILSIFAKILQSIANRIPGYQDMPIITNIFDFQRIHICFAKIKQLVGDGLVIAEGDLWKHHHRKTIVPIFTCKAVGKFAATKQTMLSDFCEPWDQVYMEYQL